MKRQTEDVEAKMQQRIAKQQRSVELNALRTSGRASRKAQTKKEEDEEVEEEVEEIEEEPDAARKEVLAALEREKDIEAKKRSEEVAKDSKSNNASNCSDYVTLFFCFWCL